MPLVKHLGLRQIEVSVSQKPASQSQIDVFQIRAKVDIEAAGLEQELSTIEASSRARREYLLLLLVARRRFIVAAFEGGAIPTQFIAGVVDEFRLFHAQQL